MVNCMPVPIKMTKRSLYNLICNSRIAVVLPGSPHSELVLVRFVVTRGFQLIFTALGDLANDYFFTNNNIAFVIGNDDNGTILYVGRIKKITADKLRENMKSSLKITVSSLGKKQLNYFLVEPGFIKYSHHKAEAEHIDTINF